MLHNNLDPEVAERPRRPRRLRRHRQGGAQLGVLRRHRARAPRARRTTRRCSSSRARPSGRFRTHPDAPRVLLANSNLVPKWATWDEFRRLEALGLTMFGQMTAGSWIYIGTQGILQGTYETFVAARRAYAQRTRKRRAALGAHRGARRHGRRAAARRDDGGPELPGRRGRPVAHREAPRDALRRRAGRRSRRGARAHRGGRARRGAPVSVALCGNAAEVYPELVRREVVPDLVTEQTAAHDPLERLHPARPLARRGGRAARRGRRRATSSAPRPAWPKRSSAMLCDEGARAPRSSTTATTSARAPRRPGASARSTSRASCRPTSGRSSATARARSAGSRSAAIPRTSPRPTRPCSPPSRTTPTCARWIELARERVKFQGLPARICWLGYGDRAQGRARVQRARAHRAR